MRSRMLSLCLLILTLGLNAHAEAPTPRFIEIAAKNKQQRTEIANAGIAIEAVRSESVWAIVSPELRDKARERGFQILSDYDVTQAFGQGEQPETWDYPSADAAYHNFPRLESDLKQLAANHPQMAQLFSLGKSVEGRDLWILRIGSRTTSSEQSQKPGVLFLGNHHAREHLSAEVPFLLARYLLEHAEDAAIRPLLESREIWIAPMINPDGVEFDIATAKYQWWRKNRAKNSDGSRGVDLNRNYGYQWGTGGSDKDPRSEVYMGPAPFSEPESQAVRKFIEDHSNVRVLLSFHSYSELILYPWGYTYDPVTNERDRQIFQEMAKTMAQWNHYTPQSSSELYITSGDTTDWAYGEHGLYAFTFELSPANQWGGGGFYPGAKMIDKAFADNLKPCLYLIDVAGDPTQVVPAPPAYGLRHWVEPSTPAHLFWDLTPLPEATELRSEI